MKAEVRNSPTIVKGYYIDKPLGNQWGDTGRASSFSTIPGTIVIDNDTTNGLSGAPVYENFPGCGFCGFALVQSDSSGGPNNHCC
jgi:V8-like Glu-specific endopeptidase